MYRDLYQERGVRPEDIESLKDLAKLPVVDKKDFHNRPGEDCRSDRGPSKEKLLEVKTSGSSGVTLRFWIDSGYDQFRKAQFLRPYITNGSGFIGRGVWFRARPKEGRRWFQRMGVLDDLQICSGKDIPEQVREIKRVKPDYVKGYGSAMALIASTAVERGIHLPPVRIAFTDSELLPARTRRVIEAGFQTEVVDIYGTFETDNIAYECRRHEGYHIAVDCVIMEFLKHGKPVAPGEEGEIVCTVLNNRTTPFIRYNLHDLGTFSEKQCSCGRGFPLMKITGGRTIDFAVKQDGSKVSSTTIMGNLWAVAEKVHEMQVIQEAANRFRVLVVPKQDYQEHTTKRIRAIMQKDFPSAHVVVDRVSRIDCSLSGKFKAFRSLIN